MKWSLGKGQQILIIYENVPNNWNLYMIKKKLIDIQLPSLGINIDVFILGEEKHRKNKTYYRYLKNKNKICLNKSDLMIENFIYKCKKYNKLDIFVKISRLNYLGNWYPHLYGEKINNLWNDLKESEKSEYQLDMEFYKFKEDKNITLRRNIIEEIIIPKNMEEEAKKVMKEEDMLQKLLNKYAIKKITNEIL